MNNHIRISGFEITLLSVIFLLKPWGLQMVKDCHSYI